MSTTAPGGSSNADFPLCSSTTALGGSSNADFPLYSSTTALGGSSNADFAARIKSGHLLFANR
ncbi:hypothetical protein FPZ49_27190 [Paenibacillus cremeus]|uniref:Uncharacterized protein n=1 Tax=Paenibacillus cremeus TaxID=2163881 RepID=A0A559K431_9BACL|nr:hypothetical protein FPZ49_27190 [Paenibacillus cremeus]